MIAALHIDWPRAAADIAGAFACAYVGQWWGYRRGYEAGRRGIRIGVAARAAKKGEPVRVIPSERAPQGHTPDRQDERIAP